MEKKVLLGYTKRKFYGSREPVYLYDFKWDCDWYWAGGYIGNKNFHTHFNSCFLNTINPRGHSLGKFITPWSKSPKCGDYFVIKNGASIWEPITTFLDDVPQYIQDKWWRIKDLFVQFYKLKEAAEVFQFGGHCTAEGRTDDEYDLEMAKKINKHIEKVVIREIRKIFKFE